MFNAVKILTQSYYLSKESSSEGKNVQQRKNNLFVLLWYHIKRHTPMELTLTIDKYIHLWLSKVSDQDCFSTYLSSCISLKVLDLLLLLLPLLPLLMPVICSILSLSSFFFTMSELTLLRRLFHLLRSCSQIKQKDQILTVQFRP